MNEGTKYVKIIDPQDISTLPLLQKLLSYTDLAKHSEIEILIDYYVFLTRGNVTLAKKYYPRLIRKGLINYFLIKFIFLRSFSFSI